MMTFTTKYVTKNTLIKLLLKGVKTRIAKLRLPRKNRSSHFELYERSELFLKLIPILPTEIIQHNILHTLILFLMVRFRMADKIVELGTFEESRDGVLLKFKVTTVPKEIIEEVIEHMVINFLPREPLCMHSSKLYSGTFLLNHLPPPKRIKIFFLKKISWLNIR